MSNAKELLHTAKQHFQSGNIELAEKVTAVLREQQLNSIDEVENILLQVKIYIAKEQLYLAMLSLQNGKEIFTVDTPVYILAEYDELYAVIMEQVGEHGQAIEKAKSALQLYRSNEVWTAVIRLLLQIGRLHLEQAQESDAVQYIQEAEQLIANVEINELQYLDLKSALGQALYKIGSFEQAYQIFSAWIEHYTLEDNAVQWHTIRGWIGLVLAEPIFGLYNPDIAIEYLSKAVHVLEAANEKKELRLFQKVLSQLYEGKEEWEQAYIHFERYCYLENEMLATAAARAEQKYTYERQIAVMKKEREVTDKLLHKSFPAFIIPQLKSKKVRIMEEYSPVSVLFADMVGFTKLSTEIAPQTVVSLLNAIFTHFDIIMQKYQCERIRTLGDGYLAVCGVPLHISEHAYKLASAALEMIQDYTLPPDIQNALPEGSRIQIRIGLHCGPIVAGIIGGLQKWQYDIYGDTVNTASRMESHGEPGKIHISEDFKNALVGIHRDASLQPFQFIPREPIFIKGKGLMNTYFLQ